MRWFHWFHRGFLHAMAVVGQPEQGGSLKLFRGEVFGVLVKRPTRRRVMFEQLVSNIFNFEMVQE